MAKMSPIVFISFRGADTRDKALHVYETLNQQGFNAFYDDRSIAVGQGIDVSIEEAINNSAASVIILLEKFAESEWCLDELVLILKRKKELGTHYVLYPIYVHGIDPDNVREQKGSYGEELAKHNKKCLYFFNLLSDQKCKVKVEEWRAALTEIAGYKGKRFNSTGTWSEFTFEMVKEIRQQFDVKLGIIVKPRQEVMKIDKLINTGKRFRHLCRRLKRQIKAAVEA